MLTQSSSVSQPPVVLAFVNFNSGGKLGRTLATTLIEELDESSVFNLAEGGPRGPLERYLETANLRIVACGGDGTVNWILKTVADLPFRHQPVMAILPLGTGNDAARGYGWGGKFPGFKTTRQLVTFIKNAHQDTAELLDVWNARIAYPEAPAEKYTSHHPLAFTPSIEDRLHPTIEDLEEKKSPDEPEAQIPSQPEVEDVKQEGSVLWHETSPAVPQDGQSLYSGVGNKGMLEFTFNNYLSVGVDAQNVQKFHARREAHRDWFCCRLTNLLCFACVGCSTTCFCSARGLSVKIEYRTVESDNSLSPWKVLKLTTSYAAVILLNLPTYAGGAKIWGGSQERRFAKQSSGDGLLEIVGVKHSIHLANMAMHASSGVRLAQAAEVRITSNTAAYWQLDGEPWEDPPLILEIRRKSAIPVLVGPMDANACPC